MLTSHCTPREGFQGESKPETQLRAKQHTEWEWDRQWHSTAQSQQQELLSSTAALPQPLPSHSVQPAELCSSQQLPPRHKWSRNQASELGVQGKALCTFSPTAFQERCFVTLEPKPISSKTGLACCILRQAGKRLEVNRQALLVSRQLQRSAVQASWGLPTHEPIKAERSLKN